MADAVEVRPGDVWADNDTRSVGRTIKVERVEGDYAHAVVVTDGAFVRRTSVGHRTRIRLDRMRPTPRGYRLLRRSR